MKIIIGLCIISVMWIVPLRAQMLNDYFRIAAENNPGLQSKYLEFEAAMKKVAQVSALPDPTISLGYFLSPAETRVGPQRGKVSLSQMFPWFGTLEAKANAATLLAEAKYQSFLDARNKLFYTVASSYYPLIELERQLEIEEENINILKSYKSIASKKFENGDGTMVDVLRVDILINESFSRLEILNAKRMSLLATFNRSLNRDESEDVNIADSLELPLITERWRKDSLLSDNPVLEEIDLKINASKASEEAAEKQAMPRVGVGLDYVIVGKRNDVSLPDNGKDVIMPMISLSIPFFSKKYKAAAEEERLMQESYSLKKQDLINSLYADYEAVWFRLEKNREEYRLYQEQINENQRILRLLLSAYSHSGNDFVEVLDVQQKILRFEKLQETAKMEFNVALARLNYLTAKNY